LANGFVFLTEKSNGNLALSQLTILSVLQHFHHRREGLGGVVKDCIDFGKLLVKTTFTSEIFGRYSEN